MKYLVTLKPLEPFLFGGDNTFGELGDNYIVHSRMFPQQTALLGMIQKEIMLQDGILTRKRKGEWVDKAYQKRAIELVGKDKFDILLEKKQDFKSIQSISALFLKKGSDFYIKKADTGMLEQYDPKEDIFDNFVCIQTGATKTSKKIFEEIVQTGNKKGGEENSLFKKTSYQLLDGFTFAFFLETSFELTESIVCLGADRSRFKLTVLKEPTQSLEYKNFENNHLVLLSDSLITIPIEECCEEAITSEISFRHLQLKRVEEGDKKKNIFAKSGTTYLYEKGSVFIDPTDKLITDLNNTNLQQIGYNKYSQGEK